MKITSVRRIVGSGCFFSFFTLALIFCSITGYAAEPATDPNTLIESPILEGPVVITTSNGTWSELIGQRDSNTRVWEVTKDGKQSIVREVGGGICYKDASGKWRVSDTSWTETADGFVMDKAGYRLEMGETAGSVMKYFVDGRQLKIRASGLVAESNGTPVNTASLNVDVVGQIDQANPNKLVFADAFGSGIDLEIEALPGGYHQNVIFSQKPQLPTDADAASTKFMLFTEMDLDSFESSKSGNVKLKFSGEADESMTDPNLIVTDLAREVAVSDLTRTDKIKGSIHFVNVQADGKEHRGHMLGRSKILSVLDDAGAKEYRNIGVAHKEFVRDTSHGKVFLVETLDASVLEQATYPVVWDYQSVSGSLDNNMTWKSGSTYYVSSDITVASGKTLTIESGAVVKFGLYKKLSAGSGSIIAQGKPYLPIMFTSMNDDTVGDVIPGSSGIPSNMSHYGVEISSGSKFEYCNVYYAYKGLSVLGVPAIPVQHNLFHNCKPGIFVDLPYSGSSLDIYNNLMYSDKSNNDPCGFGILIINDPCSVTITLSYNTIDWYGTGISIQGTGGGATYNIYDNLLTNCNQSGINKLSTQTVTFNAHHNGFFNVPSDSYYVNCSSSGADVYSSLDPYEGDTYYLDQNLAYPDSMVDRGLNPGLPSELLYNFTTRMDNIGDSSNVDIGYHHSCQNPYTTETWYVGEDGDDSNAGITTESPFATIQYAIDVASYRKIGDSARDNIIVNSGTYYENIQFRGVKVKVSSASGIADNVTIHGDGISPVVSFKGTEGSDCELTGFTIRSDEIKVPSPTDRWKLNEDDGLNAANMIPAINVGTLKNDASFVKDDCRGYVLKLNDADAPYDDYVVIDDDDHIDGYKGVEGKASRTCSVWIRTSGTSTSPRTILSWGIGDDGGRWLMRVGNSGYLNLKVGGGYTDTTTYIADDQWHHVAIVHDNDALTDNNITFYVDGSPIASVDVAIDTVAGPNVEVGCYAGGNYFNGSISDVRIYSEALHAGQIRRIYNDIDVPVTAGLKAHWELDNELESETLDSSGYGFDGSLVDQTAITNTTGKYKVGVGAIELDGVDEFVRIDGASGSTAWNGISGKQARTCAAWIKVPAGVTLQGAIVSWGEFDQGGERWIFRVKSGKLNLKVGGGVIGTVDLRDDTWHHVAVSIDDYNNDNEIMLSEIKFYVDGMEEVCTVSNDMPVNTDTTGAKSPNVMIGAYHDGISPTNLFTGHIDDVRIYDRALSSLEIKTLASVGGGIYGGSVNTPFFAHL